MPFVRSMPPGKSHIALTAFLAGAMLLPPQTMAPQREERVHLPADALVRAVATHNELLFDLCVADGTDVNAAGADGNTPLLVALDQGQRETVSRLLRMGASVDVADAAGRTPLMVAAAADDGDLLRTFLVQSSRPDARDADGRSAAYCAAAAHRAENLTLLLPSVEDVAAPAGDGRDLLTLAAETGDLKLIQAVLDRYAPGADWTPTARRVLTGALAARNVELVALLLSKHAGPPMVEGANIPLLAQAIVDEDLATLKLLLAAGADPNVTLPLPVPKEFSAKVDNSYLRDYVRGDEGITPLMLAAGMGRLDSTRALLEAGADKNRQTKRHNMMALYFASRTNKPQCVQLLLGRGPSRDELRVEVSLALQRASVIKNGISILQTSVSTGRKGFDTPPGEYVVTDKNRSHISTLYKVEMPFLCA